MAHTSRWPFDLGYTEWLMLEQDWVSASWVSGSIKNQTEEQVHRFDHETAGWNQNFSEPLNILIAACLLVWLWVCKIKHMYVCKYDCMSACQHVGMQEFQYVSM